MLKADVIIISIKISLLSVFSERKVHERKY